MSKATRSIKAVSKSYFPCIARSVMAATCSPTPAEAPSKSIPSSLIKVLSTSSTNNPLVFTSSPHILLVLYKKLIDKTSYNIKTKKSPVCYTNKSFFALFNTDFSTHNICNCIDIVIYFLMAWCFCHDS